MVVNPPTYYVIDWSMNEQVVGDLGEAVEVVDIVGQERDAGHRGGRDVNVTDVVNIGKTDRGVVASGLPQQPRYPQLAAAAAVPTIIGTTPWTRTGFRNRSTACHARTPLIISKPSELNRLAVRSRCRDGRGAG